MATYTELYTLFQDSDLRNRIAVAIAVAADTILNDNDDTDPPWGQTNNANRKIWAKQALSHPSATAKNMIPAVLAANKSASVSAIQTAADTAIQDNVNALVDLFADGS